MELPVVEIDQGSFLECDLVWIAPSVCFITSSYS